MTSSILSADEICRKSDEKNLIENFDIESLDGVASYDFRVGETVFVTTEAGGPSARHIREEGTISLQPGHAYAIKSKEILHLPDTIQVHLSLRFRLAAKKLFYSGGLVDPGYDNALYFVIFNLSSSEYPISYEDPIVRGEFREVGDIHDTIEFQGHSRSVEELINKGSDFQSGPNMEELLPQSPSRSREYRDWEMINHDLEEIIGDISRVDGALEDMARDIRDLEETRVNNQPRLNNVEEQISEIRSEVNQHDTAVESLSSDYEQIRTLLEYLLLAAVAAIIGSATFALITNLLM